MRARLWSMPIIAAMLLAWTAGGAGSGTARAAPTRVGGPDRISGERAGAGRGSVALIRRAASTSAPLITDAPRGQKRGQPAPATTKAMRRANQIRQSAAAHYVAAGGRAVARDLRGTQHAQRRGNWCGPATVTEMLGQMRVRFWQRAAARALGTDGSGTDWSNRHGFPVPRVLNAHQHRHRYVAVGLPWSPTRHQIRVFRIDLVSDIGHGVPIAGNGYEVAGGPHLVGHPAGATILHWFDIRGYRHSGAYTDYEDSVHGARSIGWSAGVPAYSTLPTRTIAVILGARGYVW